MSIGLMEAPWSDQRLISQNGGGYPEWWGGGGGVSQGVPGTIWTILGVHPAQKTRFGTKKKLAAPGPTTASQTVPRPCSRLSAGSKIPQIFRLAAGLPV